MSEEIKALRQALREELRTWIEERTQAFLSQLGGPIPELPVVEDFRLLICLVDASDPDGCDYYPAVDSGSAHHRQVGLVNQSMVYLNRDVSDE
jgi:hypothetical protein